MIKKIDGSLICKIFKVSNLFWRRKNRLSQYNLATTLVFQVDELGHISIITGFPLMLEELIFFPRKASPYAIYLFIIKGDVLT